MLVVYKAASLVTYGISAREKNQVRANVNLFFNCMKFKMDTWYLWLVSFPQEMNILEIVEYFVYLFVFNAFLLLTDICCWYLDLYVMSTGHCVCTGSALDSLCGRGRGGVAYLLIVKGSSLLWDCEMQPVLMCYWQPAHFKIDSFIHISRPCYCNCWLKCFV